MAQQGMPTFAGSTITDVNNAREAAQRIGFRW